MPAFKYDLAVSSQFLFLATLRTSNCKSLVAISLCWIESKPGRLPSPAYEQENKGEGSCPTRLDQKTESQRP